MKGTAFGQWTTPYGAAKPDLLAPVWGGVGALPEASTRELFGSVYSLVFPLTGIMSKACPDFLSSASLSSVCHTSGNPFLTYPHAFVEPWCTLLFPLTSNDFQSPQITVTYSQKWEERPQETKVLLLRHTYYSETEDKNSHSLTKSISIFITFL